MGITQPMRILKLFLYSVVFFFLLLTAVGWLFPANVRISRAIDLPGQQRSMLIQRINDPAFRDCWFGDSSRIFLRDDLQRTDSSWSLLFADARQRLTWVFYEKEGSVILQGRMDVELGWLPWQRFQSLLLEPRYGPWLENRLQRFKGCLLTDQLGGSTLP